MSYFMFGSKLMKRETKEEKMLKELRELALSRGPTDLSKAHTYVPVDKDELVTETKSSKNKPGSPKKEPCRDFIVSRVADQSEEETSNCAHCNDVDFAYFRYNDVVVAVMPSSDRSDPKEEVKWMRMNKALRDALNTIPMRTITVVPVEKPKEAAVVVCEFFDARKKEVERRSVKEGLCTWVKEKYFEGSVLNTNQLAAFVTGDGNMYAKSVVLLDDAGNEIPFGLVTENTKFVIPRTQQIRTIKKLDYKTVGLGGLGDQLEVMLRRLLLTRAIPDDVRNNLGLKHVKGCILYGPPGCGKTRLVATIGNLIGCKPDNVRIVNASELISKYVGQSEQQIREVFVKCDRNEDELHVLAFDEFDAIGSVRGSGESRQHADQVVNTLLAEIDGAKERSNLIVLAMTNRLDKIDPALLRPGRFEIHLKVPLPTKQGRLEIFEIHAKKSADVLDADVDMDKLASLTENYSGAEIEGVVKAAFSTALREQIDPEDVVSSAAKITGVKATMAHFVAAIKEVKQQVLTGLCRVIREKINRDASDALYEEVVSATYPKVLLLTGRPRSGKTSTVGDVLDRYDGYKKYMSSKDLLAYSASKRVDVMRDALCYSEEKGLVVIDNLDILLEAVPGQTFSNLMVQHFKDMMNEPRQTICLVCSNAEQLEYLGIFDCVETRFYV